MSELELLQRLSKNFYTLQTALQLTDLQLDIRLYLENEVILKLPIKKLRQWFNNEHPYQSGNPEHGFRDDVKLLNTTIASLWNMNVPVAWENVQNSLTDLTFPENALTIDQATLFTTRLIDVRFKFIKFFPNTPEFAALTMQLIHTVPELIDGRELVNNLELIFESPVKVELPTEVFDQVADRVALHFKETYTRWQRGKTRTVLANLPISEKKWEALWATYPQESMRESLAANPSIPMKMFDRIGSRFSNPEILCGVANNPKCPPALLIRYSQSMNGPLSEAANEHLKTIGAAANTQASDQTPNGEGGENNGNS